MVLYKSRCKKVLGKEIKDKVKRVRGGVCSVMCPSVRRGTVGSAFILMMPIASKILYNMHRSDAI